MKKKELERQFSEALSVLSEHWTNCLEFELEGHSKQSHHAVDILLQQYSEELMVLPESTDST